jgi:hypothetical protein
VAEWDADAHDGFGVVPADDLDDDIALLGAQPGAFLSWRATGEVGYWRAGHEHRAGRPEDAAFPQRADDPSDVARGEEFF